MTNGPAVIYAAKSTPDERGSIPDQIAACREWAAGNGWAVEDPAEQDENASAFHGSRGPGLERAMLRAEALAQEHGRAGLVVWHSNRLARGELVSGVAKHLIDYLRWAEQAGVELHSMLDDATFSNPILTFVVGEMNSGESRLKGANVAKGMKRSAQAGHAQGGRAPYGYRRVAAGPPEPGRRVRFIFVPHEPEAAVARRIFTAYVSGQSQRQIARDLNDDGICSHTGGRWNQSAISKLIANPIYAGKTRLKGDVYDGRHEAIINLSTWTKACQLREAGTRSKGGRGRTPRANHLLAGGLLLCGRCGSAMGAVTKPTRTPGVLYEVYCCSKRAHDGTAACSQPVVKRAPIDTAIWKFFERVAIDVEATKAALSEGYDAKLAEIDAVRSDAEREAQKTAAALARIERDYRDGKLTAERWSRLDGKLTSELEAAEAQVDRLDQQRATLADEMTHLDVETAIVERLTVLRASIVGDVRDSGRESVDMVRATLARLFEPFVLLTVTVRDGRLEVLGDHRDERQGWYGQIPDDLWLEGDGIVHQVLSPVVRTDAVESTPTAAEFPALKRTALSLGGTDEHSLQT